MKTISDRIFELLKEKNMTQREFSIKTSIPEPTISDWKRKRTNPAADKVLIICETLDVSPYDLLSGGEQIGTRGNSRDTFVISKGTELGKFIECFQNVSSGSQQRIKGYLRALMDIENDEDNK